MDGISWVGVASSYYLSGNGRATTPSSRVAEVKASSNPLTLLLPTCPEEMEKKGGRLGEQGA